MIPATVRPELGKPTARMKPVEKPSGDQQKKTPPVETKGAAAEQSTQPTTAKEPEKATTAQPTGPPKGDSKGNGKPTGEPKMSRSPTKALYIISVAGVGSPLMSFKEWRLKPMASNSNTYPPRMRHPSSAVSRGIIKTLQNPEVNRQPNVTYQEGDRQSPDRFRDAYRLSYCQKKCPRR